MNNQDNQELSKKIVQQDYVYNQKLPLQQQYYQFQQQQIQSVQAKKFGDKPYQTDYRSKKYETDADSGQIQEDQIVMSSQNEIGSENQDKNQYNQLQKKGSNGAPSTFEQEVEMASKALKLLKQKQLQKKLRESQEEKDIHSNSHFKFQDQEVKEEIQQIEELQQPQHLQYNKQKQSIQNQQPSDITSPIYKITDLQVDDNKSQQYEQYLYNMQKNQHFRKKFTPEIEGNQPEQISEQQVASNNDGVGYQHQYQREQSYQQQQQQKQQKEGQVQRISSAQPQSRMHKQAQQQQPQQQEQHSDEKSYQQQQPQQPTYSQQKSGKQQLKNSRTYQSQQDKEHQNEEGEQDRPISKQSQSKQPSYNKKNSLPINSSKSKGIKQEVTTDEMQQTQMDHQYQQYSQKSKIKSNQSSQQQQQQIAGNLDMPKSKMNSYKQDQGATDDRPLDIHSNGVKSSNNNGDNFNQNIKKQNGNMGIPNEYEEDDGDLVECSMGCGRKFNSKALAKHEKICQKVFLEKRKKFDSKEQRQFEEEEKAKQQQQQQQQSKQTKKQVNNYKQSSKNVQALPTKSSSVNDQIKPLGGKKQAWKMQSEQFRAVLKSAKGVPTRQLTYDEQQAMQQINDDLISCPTCGRKFNEAASQRHFPICANKAKLDNIKQGGKKPRPGNNRKY